jgi:imidazoleglycerol-phosphate dehydratase
MDGFRSSRVRRETSQTLVDVELTLEGSGRFMIESPVGFLTHMIESFARHGRFDINLAAQGDLDVDQHHTVEDTGAALGAAFDKALDNRLGINRAGFFIFPMDEAVAFVSVDIGRRAYL